MEKNKTLDALKKAKKAVDDANEALDSAIRELDIDELGKVAGGGELDNVPTVDEHKYDEKDKPRY